MDDEERQEQHQFEELIQGLIDETYGCCDDFISPSTVIGLNANVQSLITSGHMKPSGIGNKAVFQKDSSIRGDTINWIENQTVNPFEVIYMHKIEKFILYLNSTCYTSIKSFESHYANYETGSFYLRHKDQFKNETGRKFSIVLYLNADWKDTDGGVLSLYPANKPQIDIYPIGGRMVLFRSDEMDHEVSASFTRDRSSIAAWLKA